MFLLGLIAREAAGENRIIWAALLCGVAIWLDIISSRRTKRNKIVILLLFSFFLAGVGISLFAEIERRKAERPFACAMQDDSDKWKAGRGEVISVRASAYRTRIIILCGGARVMVETAEISPGIWSGAGAGTGSQMQTIEENRVVEHRTLRYVTAEAEPAGSKGKKIILPGEYIEFHGEVSQPEGARNPGGYDEAEYLRREGITYIIKDAEVQLTGRRNRLRYGLARLSRRLERSLYRVFPEREASILAAMLLGERAGMDRETKLLYQKNGMAHVLAISGMHIALLAGALHFLLRLLRIYGKKSSLVLMLVLPFYAIMTGMSIPVMRALFMLLLRETAVLLDRTEDGSTSLVLSLVLLAAFRPWAVFSAGLLMSFAAVAAMLSGSAITRQILGVQRLRGLPPRRRKLLLVLLPGLLSVLLLNIFMLPLLLYFYYEFPLYSMLLNVAVLPMMSFLVAGGFLAALLGLFPGQIFLAGARLTGLIPYVILRLYDRLCRAVLRLPFALINPGHADLPIVIFAYGLLLLLVYLVLRKGREERFARKRFIFFLSGSVAFAVLFPFVTGWLNERRTRAVFLDVGQGDCSIIHAAYGPNLIVDCGSGSDSVGSIVLIPALKYYGMSEIDGVFVSHTDRDHTIGLRFLLENSGLYGVSVRRIFFAAGTEEDEMMKALLAAAKASGTEVVMLSAGDCPEWKSCRAPVLYPDFREERMKDGEEEAMRQGNSDRVRKLAAEGEGKEENEAKEKKEAGQGEPNRKRSGNEYSLVMCIEIPGCRILYTGDIGEETEKRILELWPEERLSSDILKCAHHGSRFSSSAEFLSATSPRYAVISCGRRNMYGHPHKDTLERLRTAGIHIHRIDEEGAVIIEDR